MCKKTLYNFLRYYCFLFLRSSEEFSCGDRKENDFYYKNSYAGHELLLGIILGISMAISFYIYDTALLPLILWNGVVMLISSLSLALYYWFKYI